MSSPGSESVHPVLPLPPNESQRFQAVQSLKILDTPEDPYLTSVSKLLGSLLKTPISGGLAAMLYAFLTCTQAGLHCKTCLSLLLPLGSHATAPPCCKEGCPPFSSGR